MSDDERPEPRETFRVPFFGQEVEMPRYLEYRGQTVDLEKLWRYVDEHPDDTGARVLYLDVMGQFMRATAIEATPALNDMLREHLAQEGRTLDEADGLTWEQTVEVVRRWARSKLSDT